MLSFGCLAQNPLMTASGIDWTKPASSGNAIPSQTNLWLYWNSADPLTASGSGNVISNWIDRVQGMPWTNGNSSQATATAQTIGVLFNGTTSKMTNTISFPSVSGDYVTAFLIVKCLRTSNIADGFFTDIPGNTSNGFDWSSGTVAVPNSLSALWAQPSSVIQDWIVPIFNLGAGSPKAYTNNVAAKTLSTQIFGSINGTALGATQGGGAPGDFDICVIALFTNATTSIDISTNAAWRATMHTWATNNSPMAPFAP